PRARQPGDDHRLRHNGEKAQAESHRVLLREVSGRRRDRPPSSCASRTAASVSPIVRTRRSRLWLRTGPAGNQCLPTYPRGRRWLAESTCESDLNEDNETSHERSRANMVARAAHYRAMPRTYLKVP